jgi:hypothetical protein
MQQSLKLMRLTLLNASKTSEDGRLWPKHVLVLNDGYFNDCRITDGLNTKTLMVMNLRVP